MKRYHIWITVLLIINQLFIWNVFEKEIHTTNILMILGIGIILDIILIVIVLRQRNSEKIERELEEITAQYEYEKLYYQEVEKNREEMARIRHDYNNYITSVVGLIHSGRISEASMMINEIIDKMDTVSD